jgi:long-chain acyl-CoA synthetase
MLAEANRTTPHLASYERIKKVILLDRDFDVDTELTPSLKVKRHIVEKAFKALIDLLYKE